MGRANPTRTLDELLSEVSGLLKILFECKVQGITLPPEMVNYIDDIADEVEDFLRRDTENAA